MEKEHGIHINWKIIKFRIDGNYYEGNFLDGLRNGLGKYHWVIKISIKAANNS